MPMALITAIAGNHDDDDIAQHVAAADDVIADDSDCSDVGYGDIQVSKPVLRSPGLLDPEVTSAHSF